MPRERVFYEDVNDPSTLKQLLRLYEFDETFHKRVFRNPGGKGGSPGDADGVEIKAAEMKVDGVAESLAVAEPAR